MNMKLIRDSSDNGVFKLCCWNGSIPFVVYDHIFCEPRKILASGIWHFLISSFSFQRF